MTDRAEYLISEASAVLKGVSDVNTIFSPEEFAATGRLLLQIKGRIALVEDYKTEQCAPAKALIKATADSIGSSLSDYLAIEARLKALMANFIDTRLPAAMKDAQAALAAGDQAAMLKAMKPIPTVPGISTRTIMDFEPTGDEIPPSYFLPPELDSKRILVALREGVTIPGIRKIERTSIAVTLGEK